MYKVHVGHREPEPGTLAFGAHILLENEPMCVVETKEQARGIMRQLIAEGFRPDQIYAVGFDLPGKQPDDA